MVADQSRTDKTICLAVSPALKGCGIPGRPRLFEVVQKVRQVNAQRQRVAPQRRFTGKSANAPELAANPSLELDYIVLPHHVSQNHPQMSLRDRAAQFAPFAALTGYEAAVGETARQTAERRELDPQEAEELNCRLAALIARLPERPEVTIEYFVPDDRKSGVRM